MADRKTSSLAALAALLAGCGSHASGGASLAASAAVSSATTTPSPTGTTSPAATTTATVAAPAPSGVALPRPDFDALAKAQKDRADAYLRWCLAVAPQRGEGLYTQLARLELGQGPLDQGALTRSLDHVEQRLDTADFHVNGLLRLLLVHGASPLFPPALRARTEKVLLDFRYSLEDPSRGEVDLCFWSENHQILYATAEYLLGDHFASSTFGNAKLTGAQHAARGKAKVLRWLDHRQRFGFSEWYSPVYWTYDLLPLLNLAELAPDPAVRKGAAQVLDLMLFDFARLTHLGSFGVTAGRAYEEHKLSGWGQSPGDLIEIVFGTRGAFRGNNSPGAIWLAAAKGYTVPHVLLGIGVDRPARFTDRARSGISIAEGPSHGIGFQSLDDVRFWWGMGAYFAKETVVATRRTILANGLQDYPAFKQALGPMKAIPDALLPTVANTLSPLSEGSVLSTANVAVWRTPGAMLSSVQSHRKGQVGFQTHIWQATLGLDALCFTTAPGTFGHDGPGPWTGSGSQPRVAQVENVALILYDPPLSARALFPAYTHAFLPRAAFDEVVSLGRWTFARKGDGFVALASALPTYWMTTGAFADRELIASGARNVWVCQVGDRAIDGSFAAFRQRIAAARLDTRGEGNGLPQATPLGVTYDAPGVGLLQLDWTGAPSRNGKPIAEVDYPRFDNLYGKMPFGARTARLDFGGASLDLDFDTGARIGRGL